MARRYDLQSDLPWTQKLLQLSWGLIFLLTLVACVGFTALYSAANGHLDPWASRQIVRFLVGVCGMIFVAMIDIRLFHRFAYILYAGCFVLLIIVEAMGRIGMGAQRWIDLGFIQVQPSELMKIAVILALARYFHRAEPSDMRRISFLIPAALLVLAPVGLIALQPDLGTAMMIGIASTGVFFIAGAPVWMFLAAFACIAAAIPVAWHFMHDYQRQRVLTFLDPERDPLGAGYHITQSKIALGSGGVSGKGFLHGTQSHLNFLPEKQTDFIFTLWAEEWGLVGGLFLIALFGLIFMYGIWISLRCRHAFGRIVALGLTINFSVYVFINIAMVMGLIPVVGAPLPLVSYGGTAMLAVLCGFGIVMSCNIYRDAKLSRL
jgi:rod shape determining protein RodA